MKFGVQLPEVERVVGWKELEAMARTAEGVGFDSIWVGDHLLYELDGRRVGPWEAWTQLAALAAVTERVRLGPLVAALPFHPPAVLAKMAATVDEISGGRLVLGVGAGWNRVEFEAFGLPFDHRVSRFEEAFHILRRLLAGERVDFAGTYFRVMGCELVPPPRPGGPPLMIGSVGPRMLHITLPYVKGWNAWFEEFDNDPDQLGRLLARVDRICEEVGRDPTTVEKSVAVLVRFDDSQPRRNSTNPIRGSAEEMRDRLGRIGEVGIDHVQLVLEPITIESIERAGQVFLRG